MNQPDDKFMRLVVMFDLPVKTIENRRHYTLFRRFLIKDGYDMMQLSVYARLFRGRDTEQTHLARLHVNLPPAGSVRCFSLTEKQYTAMKILVGEPTVQEKNVPYQQLLLF